MRAAVDERVALEFGRLVARVHERLGGDPAAAAAIARWGQRAWREAGAGHVCVDVTDAAEREVLAASPAVGAADADRPTPLVLDLDALYLHRLRRAECALARSLASLDEPAVALAREASVDEAIAQVFGARDADDAQQRAVRRVLGHRLAVLTGGPGTGKTTTLARLVVAFARLAPDARIVFAAPTGKAAARLAQSISAQLARFDPDGRLRARLPSSGVTVHRLLGAGAEGLPECARVLDHDLIIVDEASMLDIELAAALAASIGTQARLVLAGDRDQLASVEAGAVFADVCSSAGEAVVTLSRNYRQQDAPHITALAAQVRDACQRAGQPMQWPARIVVAEPDLRAIVDDALSAWREVLEAIDAGAEPAQVLTLCDRHRVLAALREGPFGSLALNRAIAESARREWRRSREQAPSRARRAAGDAWHDSAWYPGRLVMVTRNEPGLGLFNGDVGVCLARAGEGGGDSGGNRGGKRGGKRGGEPVVAFEGASGARRFAVLQMPACEDAWVVTVHKSQGSEFESVALVPAPAGHPLNTRELLYTGITRARSRLTIWSTREAVEAAAGTLGERHGRLAQRLQYAIAARSEHVPGAPRGRDGGDADTTGPAAR